MTGAVSLRPARLAEAELVREISAEAFVPAYQPVIGTAPRPALEDYRPRIERGEVWILQTETDLIGVLVLERRSDALFVYSIAVRPSQQRRGYGRLLLGFAEQQARLLGLREVQLYTNDQMTQNLRLYRSCGYVEAGRRPHAERAGVTLVDMKKPLG
jgi:ribosomal protein S18 acetylase RimI-like enzyme